MRALCLLALALVTVAKAQFVQQGGKPVGPSAPPIVTSVVNAAGFGVGPVSPGSWVSIFGNGLAPPGDSRQWNPATEILNGVLPDNLDGTSVLVNGQPAAVEFISPSQVNIQTPDDLAVGTVQVTVESVEGSTAPFIVTYAQFGPGLFLQGSGPYLAAQHADGSYVSSAAPAIPGEVIMLWGTGFGPASPVVPAGQVFTGANTLANSVKVTIGGQAATVYFAGVVGAGLVQINVQVPGGAPSGDVAVVADVGGVSTQPSANLITVR